MFSNNSSNFTSIIESLEERVLFDGVPDATFLLPSNSANAEVPVQTQLEQADFSAPRELVLIDAGVQDGEQLLASLLESKSESAFEIRFLEADSDGVQQISEILSSANYDYDAIHILSHGDEGQVALGNTVLSADNLSEYADELAGWADALTGEADLLFYGCELAGNENGEQFIESVSAMTGADVAASDDLTGAAVKGGDWELELNVGEVETEALSATAFAGILADADGDGVDDVDDLDDDNDGILDADEGAGVGGTPFQANGDLNVTFFNEFQFSFGFGLQNPTNQPISDWSVSIENANYTFNQSDFTNNNLFNLVTTTNPDGTFNHLFVGNSTIPANFGPFPNIEIMTVNFGFNPTSDGLVTGTGGGGGGTSSADTDGDGIADQNDLDSDNDGISDLQESGDAVAIAADMNMDGFIDNTEATAAGLTDNDGDGVWDTLGNAPADTDTDGVADFLDLDSDNDGIPDAVEAQPTVGYQSPAVGSDADGDGVVDTFDSGTGHGGNFTTPEDTDGDGTADYLDQDSDNDGLTDTCLLYTSPSPRDATLSRMPSSA